MKYMSGCSESCHYFNYNRNINDCDIHHQSKIQTDGTWGALYKPVLQLDLEGNIIREFVGIFEACEVLGLDKGNISACCRQVRGAKTCGGFRWRFKEEK